MNEQKLKKLIELVDFDQAFIDLAQKIQSLEKSFKNLEHQKEQLEKDLAIQTSKKHEALKQLHDQELKLKELQTQEAHLAEISASITTSKEFDAAHKEVDKVKFARNQEEQKMMQLSNKVETAQKDYLLFLEQFELEKEKIIQQELIQAKEIKAMQDELVNLNGIRQEKLVGIPTDWLNTYESMRGRVTNPVVPLNQESCSACFYFMSSRDVQMLHDQGLLQCKDCYRFLYHIKSIA